MSDGPGWITLTPLSEVREGLSVHLTPGGDRVLLFRSGDRLFAATNRCTHQGAPLQRGTVRTSGSLVTITCPIHGSTFELSSGRVLRGPAMVPLPIYEARINEDGVVEVRPRAV
jgi:nitrite reductase/ring-hydroxylating ferredoxin subunit